METLNVAGFRVTVLNVAGFNVTVENDGTVVMRRDGHKDIRIAAEAWALLVNFVENEALESIEEESPPPVPKPPPPPPPEPPAVEPPPENQ